MPCLFALFALMVPRVVIVLLWLFSNWFTGMFDNILWPILGFVFLPTTLLWYSVVMNWMGGIWDIIAIVGLIIAIVIDAAPASGRR